MLILLQHSESTRIRTFIVREVVLHRADRELFSEPIDLVQEKNDTGLEKPSGITDRVEQCQSFLHTVYSFVLKQELVVLRDGYQEENGCYILKAVDPLLTFRSLTTNIKHTVGQVANNESGFSDTGCFDTRPEDILVCW